MISRMPSPTENKLLLLYAVERLGPVTSQQLLRFMVEHGQMNYITLQLSIAELSEAGLLSKRSHELGTLYSLSAEGEETLALFTGRIPPSRRQCVDEAPEVWRSRFKRERQMLSECTQLEGGDYLVRLKVLEGDQSLMELSLRLPDRKDAHRFCDVWESRASAVYGCVMRLLGEGSDGAETDGDV